MVKIVIKSRKLWYLLGLILFLSAIVLFYSQRSSQYDLIKPRKGPIVEAIYGIGTVKAHDVYHQKLGVLGTLARLYVNEGDKVGKGALLTKTSDQVFFRAPFAGTVTKVYFHEKEIVMPGSTILELMNLNKKYITVSLDQEAAIRVKPGQPAEISAETIRGQVLLGKVSRIYPADGSFIVKILVEQMPESILPEMTADVAIQVARREEALMVPMTAIHRGLVRIKRQGKKQKIKIKVGAISAQWAEVVDSSIKETDEIYVPRL